MMKLQSKKPLLRFPEFKDAWDHKKLSELLVESKKRNETLKFSKEEVLSVSGELGIVNQIEHLGRSYAGVSVHNYHIVENGDIVYTKSPLKANPYGIIKLNKGKAGIVSTLYAVYKLINKNAHGPFLDYYFFLNANTNRYLRPLVKKGAKNDMKINNSYVLHDRIFVPNLPEQKKICTFLTAVDNKIQQLIKQKELLEQYKKGCMQQIFSQIIRFKDDKGKAFPDWKEKKLSDIALKKSSNISANTLKENKGEYKIYGAAGIWKDIDFYREKEQYISIVKDGAGVGRVFLCNPKTSVLGTLDIIKSKEGIRLNYLYLILQTIDFTQYITGSTIPHIYFKDYSKELVKLPVYDEQMKIANFLSAIDNKISNTSTQLLHTQQYKKGLLQQMFI